MADPLCVIRGGGDLATGVAWALHGRGWPVIVLELAKPLTVRRAVALSTAVVDGSIEVQGMKGVLAESPSVAIDVAGQGEVAVLVSPDLPELGADVVIDARLAKRNLDTSIDNAGFVVALGPGFTAGVDCHAVVETNRGPHLGQVIWDGSAQPDTGVPGEIGGHGADRVLRAPADGVVSWSVEIGDQVNELELIGSVGSSIVAAPFSGVLRGAIRPGMVVREGLKIGDVDARGDRTACFAISDKALAIGNGVVAAVQTGWPTPARAGGA